MRAARQQRARLDLRQQPHPSAVALAAMLVLLATVLLAGAAPRSPILASLPHGDVALLANAFVCGVLSNPQNVMARAWSGSPAPGDSAALPSVCPARMSPRGEGRMPVDCAGHPFRRA